ncbi:hypothetical protein [Virgibacillus halodenitrificans]|uniref:Uncharacterized protein n=1 Tax=Virgibacillus halodenitrificans TaxID=1482 RepID=A0ABR7VQG9_VIRHA|nr:hypothetical protein [Virgibacillus halodenitrificans]MBD1222787.1 hypothetical protein [Virgibacillus halodenitrificans]
MKFISALNAINDYFFDLEDQPETDWLSCILFYGVIILSLIITVICLIGILFT